MNKLYAILLTVLLLAGCSRAGFKDSVENRETPPSKSNSQTSGADSSDTSSLPPSTLFSIESREIIDDGVFIAYAVPSAQGELATATNLMTSHIEKIISQLSGSFSMTEKGASLDVYDSVTKNGDGRFSLLYEGVYKNDALPKGRKFAFGLTFNSKTGLPISVEKVMAPNTLASLLCDEQASKLRGKDPEIAAKQREAISGMGISTLSGMIIAAEPQSEIDHLLTFSYFLDAGNLVAIIPVTPEAGDIAIIEIANNA